MHQAVIIAAVFKERTLRFIGRKKTIKRKNNEKLSRIEALLENESIKSKYTRDELEAGLEFWDAFERERKRRRRENRRRLVVKWVGYFFAFVGGYGFFFILVHLSGVIRLLFDVLWPPLGVFLFMVLLVGCLTVPIITFCWLSNKTGFRFWIENWVEGWDTYGSHIKDYVEGRNACGNHNILKFKEFPRRERRALVRELEKVLNVISIWLMDLEKEADDNDDEKLSGSVESIRQLIGDLSYVSSAFLSLGLLQECASWKTFTLTLEETAEDFKLELAGIAKFHEKVQPALELASLITAKVLSIIIDRGNRKEAKETVSQLIQALSPKKE